MERPESGRWKGSKDLRSGISLSCSIMWYPPHVNFFFFVTSIIYYCPSRLNFEMPCFPDNIILFWLNTQTRKKIEIKHFYQYECQKLSFSLLLFILPLYNSLLFHLSSKMQHLPVFFTFTWLNLQVKHM